MPVPTFCTGVYPPQFLSEYFLLVSEILKKYSNFALNVGNSEPVMLLLLNGPVQTEVTERVAWRWRASSVVNRLFNISLIWRAFVISDRVSDAMLIYSKTVNTTRWRYAAVSTNTRVYTAHTAVPNLRSQWRQRAMLSASLSLATTPSRSPASQRSSLQVTSVNLPVNLT